MSADLRALIDRIADALGAQATPERVERVARAVLDARTSSPGRNGAPAEPRGGLSRVVVTAYGTDTPGVLAAITDELAGQGANILDVSQKVLQGYFTVVLVADLPPATEVGAVRERLASRGERLGVRTLVQHEELFQAMHRP